MQQPLKLFPGGEDMRACVRSGRGFILTLIINALTQVSSAGVSHAETAGTSISPYGDWRRDAPGQWRKITPADMPAPYASSPVALSTQAVPPPADFRPLAPAGFRVERLAEGLAGPRAIRPAPNGDIFVIETDAGAVRVLRPDSAGKGLARNEVFAAGLDNPSGLAFYPPGEKPDFIYVATETRIVRFPYRSGDLQASTSAQTIVDNLPRGGHSTRDLVFSRDGATLFVAVGSKTNVAEGVAEPPPAPTALDEKGDAPGVMENGPDRHRATVLAFNPQGGERRVFASGLRNCAAMALKPASSDLWCVVNERDMLGDDTPPDYATSVKAGGFYGWPWFYIGGRRDPRHPAARADLADKVVTPDVLLPPHGAPVSIAFYDGAQFPADFRGNAFVALHGSWNRSHKIGYKVVRLEFVDGGPSGRYQDFLTGFVLDDIRVAGRPSGLAVLPDGSLLVGEDGAGVLWRVTYRGK
jgi:glucose/arabinose dehydrogenase